MLNLEQVRNKGTLSNDLWAILSEIFGHENSSKYLSSHVPNIEVKDLSILEVCKERGCVFEN